MSNLWERVMIAGRAALLAFNESALIPSPLFDYESQQSRLLRYRINEHYYLNTIYKDLVGNAIGSQIKATNNLYRHIRAIRNPVKRLVDLYPALVYGGSLDLDNPRNGAIPIEADNKDLFPAIAQLWKWSNWETQKSTYVRTGAMLGDSFIKVVDQPEKNIVYMELLDPGKVREADFDAQGNIKRIVIEYWRGDNAEIMYPGELEHPVRPYLYTEIIDNLDGKITFSTFKDRQPFAYVEDTDGNPVPKWDEDYGFIPVVHAPHMKLRGDWGFVPYHGVYDKINEANDFASHLNDQVRNAVDAIFYFAGVQAKKDITPGETSANRESRRNEITALYGPLGSKPEPMIAPLDIVGALAVLNSQLDEITHDLPELALNEARDQLGKVSGIAIENMYRDAAGLIREAQGNYDGALVRAQQMGISIAATRGYDGFAAFDANSYANNELTHRIKPRSIFNTSVTTDTELAALNTLGSQPIEVQRLILQALGKSDEDIAAVLNAAKAQQAASQQAAQSQQQPNATDPNAQAAQDASMEELYKRLELPTPSAKSPKVAAGAGAALPPLPTPSI